MCLIFRVSDSLHIYTYNSDSSIDGLQLNIILLEILGTFPVVTYTRKNAQVFTEAVTRLHVVKPISGCVRTACSQLL